jgi:hypothetical protein
MCLISGLRGLLRYQLQTSLWGDPRRFDAHQSAELQLTRVHQGESRRLYSVFGIDRPAQFSPRGSSDKTMLRQHVPHPMMLMLLS